MPTYPYECECGRATEIICPVKDYQPTQPCECGSEMKRVYTPHYAVPDINPYRSTITGEVIGSRSSHRAHLKQHGCIEIGNEKWPERKHVFEPGLKKDIAEAIKEVRSRHA